MLPQPTNLRDSQFQSTQQKENFVPAAAKNIVNGNGAEVTVMNDKVAYDDGFTGSQPAIPPEIQEAMMYTPVKKRVGALRRSPI